MRENRTYGSEGGEGVSPSRPLSKQSVTGCSINAAIRRWRTLSRDEGDINGINQATSSATRTAARPHLHACMGRAIRIDAWAKSA